MATARKKTVPTAKTTKSTQTTVRSKAAKPTEAARPAKAGKAPKPAPKMSWSDAIKQALEKKQQQPNWPEQPKPRDTVVQKVRKDAF